MERDASFDDPAEQLSARAVTVLPEPDYRPPSRATRRFLGRRGIPAQAQPPAIESTDVAAEADSVLSELPAEVVAEVVAEPPAELPSGRGRLLAQVAEAIANPSPHAIVQFGLDNFRHLNSGLGAEVGDVVLRRVGVILTWVFPGKQVTRVDGDCYVAVFPFSGLPAAKAQVERCLTLIGSTDLSNDGSGVRATASAGITILDRPGLTASGAVIEADLAMAAAKRVGRNNYTVYDAMESATVSAVHEWATQIRHAVEVDGFVLHAQPVRSLRGDADQWELLVRLPMDDGELLPPSQFIPIAERFGLMQRVDEWVTRSAIAIIADHAAVGQVVRLEVNVGEGTLASQSFVGMVEDELIARGIDPSCLVFEVNGSTADVNLNDVRAFSERLRGLGCLFAVDGFGSSHGALDQLKVLPLDFVKIDGSFVRHLPASHPDQCIVRGLTDLAHSLGCRVIAMSVSDDESQSLLDEIGVDYVQGYHVGRPEPLNAEVARV